MSGVEGPQCGVELAVGGEGLAVRGGQPGSQQRFPGRGETASVPAELSSVGSSAEVGEYDCLFGEGVGQQGRGFGGPSGRAGVVIVLPGSDRVAAVEGLPACERVGIGQDCSKRLLCFADAVAHQLFDMLRVLPEGAKQGGRAEPPVELTNDIDLFSE